MLRKVFGKKPNAIADDQGGLPLVGTPVEGGLQLKSHEVRQLVVSSAERRGYPEPARAMIANRVVWLERRGMFGLAAWILELVEYAGETLEQRFSMTRPDGSTGRVCPFVFASLLNDKLDEITSAEDDQPKVLHAPAHPVLLLPKLASYLGPTGRLITVYWIVDGKEILRSVMDGFRIAHRGDREHSFEAYMRSDRIAISRYPEEFEPVPPLSSGHMRDVVVPTTLIGQLVGYMKATA